MEFPRAAFDCLCQSSETTREKNVMRNHTHIFLVQFEDGGQGAYKVAAKEDYVSMNMIDFVVKDILQVCSAFLVNQSS